MFSEIVQVGDKIEIKQLDHNGELINNSKVYVSQLVDYIDDEKISIAAPIKNGRIILLEKGQIIDFIFTCLKVCIKQLVL